MVFQDLLFKVELCTLRGSPELNSKKDVTTLVEVAERGTGQKGLMVGRKGIGGREPLHVPGPM